VWIFKTLITIRVSYPPGSARWCLKTQLSLSFIHPLCNFSFSSSTDLNESYLTQTVKITSDKQRKFCVKLPSSARLLSNTGSSLKYRETDTKRRCCGNKCELSNCSVEERLEKLVLFYFNMENNREFGRAVPVQITVLSGNNLVSHENHVTIT